MTDTAPDPRQIRPLPRKPATDDKLALVAWAARVAELSEHNLRAALVNAYEDPEYPVADIYARSGFKSKATMDKRIREVPDVTPRKPGGHR